MARVKSTGARISILRAHGLVPEPTSDLLNLAVCIFVELDDGTRVDDPDGNTSTYGGAMPKSLDEVEATLSLALSFRQATWTRILEVLRDRYGVRTDAETLMHLPFAIEPDDEVRALVGGAAT